MNCTGCSAVVDDPVHVITGKGLGLIGCMHVQNQSCGIVRVDKYKDGTSRQVCFDCERPPSSAF